MSQHRPLRGPLRRKQSKIWKRHSDDWYVEPEWCSQRLFEREQFEGKILDPACGMGRIVKAARAAGHKAEGLDLKHRGFKCATGDFFARTQSVDNIVCNPPYSRALAFTNHALLLAKRKVCMLLPAGWVQGEERSRWLAQTPFKIVWWICPRPSMPPGTVIAAGVKPGNGTTDYAWFCFERGYQGQPGMGWVYRDPD